MREAGAHVVRGDGDHSAWIERHPVATYYVLAYVCSWAIAIPLALQAQGILALRMPFALHYVSGMGPTGVLAESPR